MNVLKVYVVAYAESTRKGIVQAVIDSPNDVKLTIAKECFMKEICRLLVLAVQDCSELQILLTIHNSDSFSF